MMMMIIVYDGPHNKTIVSFWFFFFVFIEFDNPKKFKTFFYVEKQIFLTNKKNFNGGDYNRKRKFAFLMCNIKLILFFWIFEKFLFSNLTNWTRENKWKKRNHNFSLLKIQNQLEQITGKHRKKNSIINDG